MLVLGIESSCDETAAAVVDAARPVGKRILSNVVFSQWDAVRKYGGVVPEVAARAHVEKIDPVVDQALAEAGVSIADLDGISATTGPGLIGGVMSGVMCAKGLSAATGKPLIGVNHLGGHALTPRLTDGLQFPYLMLLVSGGHCQFLIARGPDDFSRIGGTIDDAPGEAFDKTARLLGLVQPGGPAVQKEAALGDPKRFRFPRPMLDRAGCDMSFSGLKTAVLRARNEVITDDTIRLQDVRDLCSGFQSAVVDVLVEKSRRALTLYLAENPSIPALAVAGGVAANTAIRAGLENVCAEMNVQFTAPPLALCTDNAAMIAYAGLELFEAGYRDDLSLSARPRWPLDTSSAPMLGSGKKGAKA